MMMMDGGHDAFVMNDDVHDNNYWGCKFFLNDITQWKRNFE